MQSKKLTLSMDMRLVHKLRNAEHVVGIISCLSFEAWWWPWIDLWPLDTENYTAVYAWIKLTTIKIFRLFSNIKLSTDRETAICPGDTELQLLAVCAQALTSDSTATKSVWPSIHEL